MAVTRTVEGFNMIATSSLIKSGLSLVPIPFGLKGPTTDGWNSPENCISSIEASNKLDGLNVGLAHAYCTPTPTCAIDIDNYQHAKRWFASNNIEINLLIQAVNAVVIWSGKRNSLKLLYRLPVNIAPLVSRKIVGPDEKSAVEFRCASKNGKTVQDVLPPSRHPDGHNYQWLGHGNPLEIPEIPPVILELWVRILENKNGVARRKKLFLGAKHPPLESPREIATLQSALLTLSADCGYERWRDIVWGILGTGWNCAESIAIEWSRSAPDVFEDDAFWTVANSYLPDRSDAITLGTVYYHAKAGGWNV